MHVIPKALVALAMAAGSLSFASPAQAAGDRAECGDGPIVSRSASATTDPCPAPYEPEEQPTVPPCGKFPTRVECNDNPPPPQIRAGGRAHIKHHKRSRLVARAWR